MIKAPTLAVFSAWIFCLMGGLGPVEESVSGSTPLSLELSQGQLVVHAPVDAPVVVDYSEDLTIWHELTAGLAEEGQLKINISTQGLRLFRARAAESVVITKAGSLEVEVHPEVIMRPDGEVWSVPPRTVLVRPGTNFLAGDIFDGKLHVLARRIHDGAIYYARVIADTNGVVQSDVLEAIFPTTAIPKTVAAIAAHRPLKAVLIGDSLTEGAGESSYPEHWGPLIFEANAATNAWTLVGQVKPLSYQNYGVGGLTAEYGLIVTRVWSPVLTAGYDVAIVGFGANTVVGDAPLVETMVHSLRAAGIEVILQTGERRFDGFATPLLDAPELLQGIATAQGCAIADTYSYMLETDGAYSADKVHQSVLGQQIWAGCLRSVLNGLKTDGRRNVPSETIESLGSLTESLRAGFPNAATVQFTPTSSTGIPFPASFYDNIASRLGGIPVATAVTLLTVGQSATFHADSACAVSLLSENLNGESAKVRVDFGNEKPSVTFTIKGAFGPRMPAAAIIGTWNTNLPVDLTVTVTEGMLRLAGVSFPVRW